MSQISVIITIGLFVLSVLLGIIGWLVIDKLSSIKELLNEFKRWLMKLDDKYDDHEKRIIKLELNEINKRHEYPPNTGV